MTTLAPYRADHVGSFLRPQYLIEARQSFRDGKISAEALRIEENRAISEIVKFQEDIGLKGITDGEFRRTYFHVDFLEKIKGVETSGGIQVSFKRKDGNIDFSPPVMRVTGKLRHVSPIQLHDFEYLHSVITKPSTAKVCIPSPSMLHFRGGRNAISREAYPTLEPEFYDDVAECYRAEIKSLANAGCTYLQMDDTNLAYLCDPKMREGAKSRGDDPNELPLRYARLINSAIAEKPEGMRICIHLCRGNFRSGWAAEGDYEPVAEVLFNELNVDGYFLEYDDERSGSFRPLRHVPKKKQIVLGIISTKIEKIENESDIKRRIDEAAVYVPMEQLSLSPQCGFSSTVHGNDIAYINQKKKLELVVKIANDVWGHH
jgi:5-methyltetrahydropteroyltriglutamate--homocysteine methyltransferase